MMSHLSGVLAVRDERCGDEVDVVLDAEEQVALVLLAEKILLQHHSGEIHAFVVAHHSPEKHRADGAVALDMIDREDQLSVGDQDPVPLLQTLGKGLVADRAVPLVPFALVGGEGERIPLPDSDAMVPEGPGAVLGTLGIQHDGNRLVQLVTDLLDGPDFLQMLRVVAVREVQSGHVHARFDHLLQHLFRRTGRTDGTDNLCFSHVFSPLENPFVV